MDREEEQIGSLMLKLISDFRKYNLNLDTDPMTIHISENHREATGQRWPSYWPNPVMVNLFDTKCPNQNMHACACLKTQDQLADACMHACFWAILGAIFRLFQTISCTRNQKNSW
uniref:Uncharacterized protein n=1 Tax=Micrurus lemniscatus lemniscatus TaxID=129467 RepID=A0A2D4HH13_MICLE